MTTAGANRVRGPAVAPDRPPVAAAPPPTPALAPGLAAAGLALTHETLARGLAATLEESLQGVQGLSLQAGPSLSETLGQSLQRQLMAMIPRGLALARPPTTERVPRPRSLVCLALAPMTVAPPPSPAPPPKTEDRGPIPSHDRDLAPGPTKKVECFVLRVRPPLGIIRTLSRVPSLKPFVHNGNMVQMGLRNHYAERSEPLARLEHSARAFPVMSVLLEAKSCHTFMSPFTIHYATFRANVGKNQSKIV